MRVVVTDAGDPPFAVDATVHEEDTWLALSAPFDTITSPGHPVRVLTAARNAEPVRPGTVVVQAGRPTRLLAVVHDLDAEPSWRRAWLEQALDQVFEEADRRALQTLRLPLLGACHGDFPPRAFARMLGDRLARRAGSGAVRRIWLVRRSESADVLLQAMSGRS